MAKWLDKYEQGGMVLKQKTYDNYGKKANPNDVQASVGPGFVGLGYNTKGRNYSPAWGGQFQNGGFLQPNSSKLLEGYVIPYNTPSTELAMSIGGEEGEPAYLIPSFKGGKKLKDPITEYKKTGEHLGGPFKTWQEAEKFGEMRHQYVEKRQSLPSPYKFWGDMAMGGALPGAVGFMYARTQNPAPSNGPYAKKTKASAQNGQEMKFYQEGLDFKPKTISKNGSIIKDNRGQWAHPGEVTQINSNNITMQGVDYPVLGISDTGHTQMMQPNQDYKFDGEKVTEYPMMQEGGWLDKYQDGGNINKKLKEEAEEFLARQIANRTTMSQYTPKKGEAERLEKEKAQRREENAKPLSRLASNPNAEAFGRNIPDAALFALDVMTLGEASLALKTIAKPALKAAAKYATEKTALKNAYKLNPYAVKENPSMYLYRAQPRNFDISNNELEQLKNISNPKFYHKEYLRRLEQDPEYIARTKSYGQWFDKNPERMPFYIQKNGEDGPVDILRIKLDRAKANAYNVSATNEMTGLPKYALESKISLNNPTEFILPKNLIDRAIKVDSELLPELIERDKKFNTPDWLKGYKEVPKPTSTQRVTRGPINYWEEPGFMKRNPNFNAQAYANSPVGNPSASRDIPKGMEPRLSKDENGGWLNKYK